jgi:hypothetical protein
VEKRSIHNVPRYFEPHIHDCFQNVLSSQLLFMGLNPKILLADYLSFLYDADNGYVGLNYLFKPNTSVEFTEEELNTSHALLYYPVPVHYTESKETVRNRFKNDRVNVAMYMENNPENAHSRLKELIDGHLPVVAAVDLYYMKYHRAYKKDHGLHYVVITGYDEKEGVFELFDKYKLSSSDFD